MTSINLDKIMESFVDKYLERGTYANKEEIINVLADAKTVILNNQDKTPEEIVDIMIAENLKQLEDIRAKYPTPGYTVSMNVGNTKVKLYGGNINMLGEPMPENALFDIASTSKFFAQAVAYNLLKEGVFTKEDKIKDLDPRFVNLDDLTVNDIITFGTEFRTPGRVNEQRTTEEALDKLYNATVFGKGYYNYNDMGMMILKEMMEAQTGKKYEDLVDEYLIKPLGLKDTHLIVPNTKFHLLTGSPNAKYGKINDSTALAVGGFSGHAGVFASSDDLLKLTKGVFHNGVVPNMEEAYTGGSYLYNDGDPANERGIMGNTYVTHEQGLAIGMADKTEPKDSFVIQGSTRVNATGTPDSAHNILFNPASMGIERAQEEVAKINAEREKNGEKPIAPTIKTFEFDRDGELVKYETVDPRQLLPLRQVKNVIKQNAETMLRLRFFNEVIKEYERDYDKEISVTKNGNAR